MNYIDLLLVVIILFAAYAGWQRGFITGVIDLGIWIGSILAGFILYNYTAQLLLRVLPNLGVWARPVAFIGTVILARMLLGLFLMPIIRQTPVQVHRHAANQALGILPGLVRGWITATLVAALMLAFPLWEGLSAATRNSRLANQMAVHVEWVDEKLSPVFDDAVNRTINNLTVKPGSGKKVDLPFSVKAPEVRKDLEERMLELVNEERVKEGLKPLKADPELTPVARAHSRDMFARGYFAHITPEGKTPSDRIRAAKVRFITAGENLALGQTLTICHKGLMNSPGHRANILSKAFGRVGIGVLDGGIYGLMITQNFRN